MAQGLAREPPSHSLVIENNAWRPAVRGYLASVSYCDFVIGQMVQQLEASGLADNTVIVLWGDNGFRLGEKLHWSKFVLWEDGDPCSARHRAARRESATLLRSGFFDRSTSSRPSSKWLRCTMHPSSTASAWCRS